MNIELDTFLNIYKKTQRAINKKKASMKRLFLDDNLIIYISVFFFFEPLQEPYSFLVAFACSIE